MSDAEILGATGWSAKSWRVYLNNGLYASYLVDLSPGTYRVCCGPEVTELEFFKSATQSKKRGFAPQFRAPLARALVQRSKENMILALELFNRPSLRNRIDGFALLFCAAWEQLLKAQIIEASGEEAVYRRTPPGRPRETISLRDAIKEIMPVKTGERANLEEITDLRDKAAHLLVPEARPLLAYLFQAGILNYARRFADAAGDSFLDDATGLLSLIGEDRFPPATVLVRSYGETVGAEVHELLDRLRRDIEAARDDTFAISVQHRLVITKGPGDVGDIHLTAAGQGPAEGLIIERAVPVEKRYPYRATDLCRAIAARSGGAFSPYDLNAVCRRESWRHANNEFHHWQKITNTRLYSEKALLFILAKLQNPQYIVQVRSSYAADLKKRRAKRKSSR